MLTKNALIINVKPHCLVKPNCNTLRSDTNHRTVLGKVVFIKYHFFTPQNQHLPWDLPSLRKSCDALRQISEYKEKQNSAVLSVLSGLVGWCYVQYAPPSKQRPAHYLARSRLVYCHTTNERCKSICRPRASVSSSTRERARYSKVNKIKRSGQRAAQRDRLDNRCLNTTDTALLSTLFPSFDLFR